MLEQRPAWHHHHRGEGQLLFCMDAPGVTDVDGDGPCLEEYEGLVCEGFWDGMPCRIHLAVGEWVIDIPEQLVLVSHLAAVPPAEVSDG